uniref:Uncharacterized protein n=1 Tax=Alexandrium catenella TaxID=2925 RepID=A0A7S1LEJ2_ALECA
MGRRSHSGSLVCGGLLAAVGCIRLACVGFVGPLARAPSCLARASFDTGKVNVGVELGEEATPPPAPVLKCDEGCMTAIYDCLEEGCSVDALMSLDTKLAQDEQKILDSVEELKATQKTSYTPESAGTLAWLGNFLSRSGSLRAQLQALRGIQDNDFVQQMVKAAAVAFGGGRHGDYPKVGVSGYSESSP